MLFIKIDSINILNEYKRQLNSEIPKSIIKLSNKKKIKIKKEY